jgi:hypothetical protein
MKMSLKQSQPIAANQVLIISADDRRQALNNEMSYIQTLSLQGIENDDVCKIISSKFHR